MKFRISGEIAATPEQAIRTYHGSLETIAERLPNVARVEVLERAGHETRLRWFAKGDIPKAFHKVVSPEDLFWEDHAEWHFRDHQVYVEVARPGMKKVRSESRVVFEPTEAGSRYRFEGDLKIDVPMFGGMLERFFVGFLETNTRRFFELLAEEAAAQAKEEVPQLEAPKGDAAAAPADGEDAAPEAPPAPKAKPKPRKKPEAADAPPKKAKAKRKPAREDE